MSDEPENVILKLLREIRANQQEQGVTLREHVEWLKSIDKRMDEVHETLYAASGIAMHANVRHDTVSEEIAELRRRIERLEEKV